jgi:hypothetical protein
MYLGSGLNKIRTLAVEGLNPAKSLTMSTRLTRLFTPLQRLMSSQTKGTAMNDGGYVRRKYNSIGIQLAASLWI